ncbi:hypothetical protein CGRA01v4_06708 [Colletotrichum graminicola]|nr:hypothetical protein CGRA01v4_06708 [Colletotrichum graminicola]
MFAGVHAVRCARKMHKPLQLRSRSCLDDRQVNTMKLAPPDNFYTLTITTLTMLAAWYIEGKPEGGRPGCCPEAPLEMSPRSVRGAEPMVVKNKISKALWHVYGILVI